MLFSNAGIQPSAVPDDPSRNGEFLLHLLAFPGGFKQDEALGAERFAGADDT